jgi:hypothetical protein
MPYLDGPWTMDAELLPAGTWVPERNWDRWLKRELEVPSQDRQLLSWRRERAATSMLPPLPDSCLAVLAGDIVSAQRDGLLYSNLIKRLKLAPSDATADEVIEQMKTLGLASADWPENVGGPPRRESPRPFRKVLDWLLGLLAKVARFLLNCVSFVMTTLTDLGISAVAVGLSWQPSVSFEFPPELAKDPVTWPRVRAFFDQVLAELDEKVFSI